MILAFGDCELDLDRYEVRRKRGEPYEEALELLSGDEPDASSRGVELLRALGAAGTLRVVAAGRATG